MGHAAPYIVYYGGHWCFVTARWSGRFSQHIVTGTFDSFSSCTLCSLGQKHFSAKHLWWNCLKCYWLFFHVKIQMSEGDCILCVCVCVCVENNYFGKVVLLCGWVQPCTVLHHRLLNTKLIMSTNTNNDPDLLGREKLKVAIGPECLRGAFHTLVKCFATHILHMLNTFPHVSYAC